jgi:hypothetical protein
METLRWLGVAVAVAAACAGDEASIATTGTGGAAAGGAGASGGTGGGTIGCDPECEAPQLCSVVGVCIDEGTCKDDGDCGDGLECDPDAEVCVPGGGCGAFEATVDPIPPNLLVVLDRSCSMTASVGGQTKWDVAVGALNQMTTSFAGQIRFGLSLFPDTVTPSCQQDLIPIPPGPGNEMAIQTLLTNALQMSDPNFPDGPCVTNIDTAMQQAAAEPALTDPARDNYVMLLTDGKQAGCSAAGGDAGTTQIIGDLFTMLGVPTFVVGFGSGVDPAQLDVFAQAGGVPNQTPMSMTDYYDAQDAMSLQQAIDTIAKLTLGCTFTLDTAPPDADEIYVFFDNSVQEVPQDPSHDNGWDYDPATNTITFYGPACDQLKDGDVTDVDVVFGCPVPTPD